METTTDTTVAPERPTRSKSWIAALVLGATLALAGTASVFAASPSADPSSSATTQTDDGGSTTDDGSGTTDHQCPDRSDSDTSTDSSSSS